MQNLITKFSGIVGEAAELVADYKKRSHELDQREAKLAEDQKALDALSLELSKREGLITPVENIAKAWKEIDERAQKLSEGEQALREQQEKFKSSSDVTRQQLDTRMKDLDAIQSNLNIQQKKIDDAIKAGIDEFVSKFKQ